MFAFTQDTNQVLANLERINFWSAVNLVLMIIVGISQVDKSKQIFPKVKMYFLGFDG